MDVLFAVLVAVLTACALTAYWLRWEPWRRLSGVPGPVALPLLGSTYLVFVVPRQERMRLFADLTREYSPIFRTWLGKTPEVHISKPEHIEKVMTGTEFIDKSSIYDFLQPWLGEGLLTSSGAKWFRHRKILTPAFHFKILDNFVDVFADKCQIMVRKLKDEATGSSFDIYPYVTRCALDIICETAMGTGVNAQENSESEYVSAVFTITELTVSRVFHPWLQSDFLFRMMQSGRKYFKDLDVLHGFTRKVIQDRKISRKINSNGISPPQYDDTGVKKRLAFLDLLLDLSEGGELLTDSEIQEEVDTFMFEGHDTTSVALSWALILLGSHPDIQDRVVEELDVIFGSSDRKPTMQDLQSMKYLEMVIKETLRLYPSVPYIAREVNKDTQIGGYNIPAGVTVLVHIVDVQHDPEVWPDPESFDPDRFLPDRVLGRHPFAYVPFSGGSRNCIGQKFAMLEEKTVLSYILRSFKVESLRKREEVESVAELILRPLRGVPVKLTPR